MSDLVARTKWITHVLRERPDLATSQKIVLIALINRANVANECWPSQQRLACDTSLSERYVRAVLRALERTGMIVGMRRDHHGVTAYRIVEKALFGPRISLPVSTAFAEASCLTVASDLLSPAITSGDPDLTSGGADLTAGRHRLSLPTNQDTLQNKDPKHEQGQARTIVGHSKREGLIPVADVVPSSESEPKRAATKKRAWVCTAEQSELVLKSQEAKRPSPVDLVWSHYEAAWTQAIGKGSPGSPPPRLTEPRRKLIRARIAEGFSAEDLCRAVDGLFANEFNLGNNNTGKKHIGPDLVFRNADKVEHHGANAPERKRRPRVLKPFAENETPEPLSAPIRSDCRWQPKIVGPAAAALDNQWAAKAAANGGLR